MALLQTLFELGDTGLGAAVKDKRSQWCVFTLLTVIVVIVSALALVSAAGLRRPDIGLSSTWSPTAVQKRIDDVLSETLSKQRLAAWLAAQNALSQIRPLRGDTTFERWSAIGTLATTFTSEEARKALTRRLTRHARSSDAEVKTILRAFRFGTLDQCSLRQAISDASRAADSELRPWFDEVLPLAALLPILKGANVTIPPVKEVREQLWSDLHKYFWSEEPAGILVETVRRQFLTEALDDEVVKTAAKDYTARLVWTVAGVMFITAAMIAIFGGLARVRGLVDPTSSNGPWLWVAAAALISAWLAATLLPDVGTPFIGNAVKRFDDLYELRLDEVSRWFNGLAAAAITALVASSWASFLTEARDSKHLQLQLNSLKWSLNIGSGLLVVAVIEVFALSQWPAAFASDNAGPAITTAATAAAGAVGVVFSLILLLIYLPGSQVLRERATESIAALTKMTTDPTLTPAQQQTAKDTKSELEATLAASGFQGQSSQQLMRFAQALLPLLVSATISPLFNLFGGG